MKKALTHLAILTAAHTAAHAAIGIVHEVELTSSNDDATEDLGTGIVSNTGDVLVLVAAKSKSATFTYNVTSSDGGVASAINFIAFDGTGNFEIATVNVTTGGTFDFSVDTANTAFSTHGAYLLRADSASILQLGDDSSFRAANAPSPHNASLTFGSSNSGVVIGGYVSGSTTSIPTGLDGLANSGNNRITASGAFTNTSALSYDWLINDTTKNSRVGIVAFAEIVPEPSSTALLGLGGLALILRRKK